MILKSIKKAVKGIFKGAKKLFKGVGKAFGKLMDNDVFKVLAIGAGLVFTGGLAAGAFGLSTSGGLLGTLANSGLTKGIFAAGSKFGSGLVGALGAGSNAATAVTSGANTALTSGVPSLTQASGLGTLTPLPSVPGMIGGGAASTAGAAGALPSVGFTAGGVASGGAGSFSAAAAPSLTNAAFAAPTSLAGKAGSAVGGLLSKGAGAAKGLWAASAANPAATLIAGNVLQSAFTPDEDELLRKQEQRARAQDYRYGVNNLTGEQFNLGDDRSALSEIRQSYSQGLLDRARQRQQALLPPPVYQPATGGM